MSENEEAVKGLAGADDPAMAALLPKEEEAPAKEPTEATKEHEPSEDHPRFKKVYGKMKHLERNYEELSEKLREKDQSFQALVEHNKMLTESISKVQDSFEVSARPDPAEDPEGYEAWLTQKIMRKVTPAAPEYKIPDSGTQKAPEQPVNTKLMMQEAAMAAVHDDYYAVAERVAEKMKVDSVLREEIMGSVNPAKALYNYHLKVKEANESHYDHGRVDSSSGYEPSAPKKGKLTPEQSKMAANLGLSEEVYAKQLDFMNKR